MSTATLNGNQATIPGVDVPESQEKPKQSNRRGSPLANGLKPEYLSNPQPLEFADGMPSDHFCFEKCSKTIIEPLGFENEKDWLAFAKRSWQWRQEAETRKKEAIAADVLQQIEGDPKLLKIFKEKLLKMEPLDK